MLFSLRSISTQFLLPFRHRLSHKRNYLRSPGFEHQVRKRDETPSRVRSKPEAPSTSSSVVMFGVLGTAVVMAVSTNDPSITANQATTLTGVHPLSTLSLFGLLGLAMTAGYLSALAGMAHVCEREMERDILNQSTDIRNSEFVPQTVSK